MYSRFRQFADHISGYAVTPMGALALLAMAAMLAAPAAEAKGRKTDRAEQQATNTVEAVDGSCAVLFAGQDSPVGKVCVTYSEDIGVTIDYSLDQGFGLDEVHAWAGTDLLHMPQTGSGNPRPGRFPAAADRLGGLQGHSVTIALTDLVIDADNFCGNLHIAAHAALSNGESAWAGEARVTDKGSWATYFVVHVKNCTDPS